jgi:hypothetical protein
MLQVGFFDDFKGDDLLLIWGDAEGIASFLKSFQKLSAGEADHCEVGRETSPSVLKLHLSASSDPNVTFVGDDIIWTIREQTANDVMSLIAALDQVDHGHQYFDTTGPLVKTVMISKGEYPHQLPVRIAT